MNCGLFFVCWKVLLTYKPTIPNKAIITPLKNHILIITEAYPGTEMNPNNRSNIIQIANETDSKETAAPSFIAILIGLSE